MTPAFQLLARAKKLAKTNAFLTSWGLKQMARMTRVEIEGTFGPIAAEFREAIRTGRILSAKPLFPGSRP